MKMFKVEIVNKQDENERADTLFLKQMLEEDMRRYIIHDVSNRGGRVISINAIPEGGFNNDGES